MVAEKTLVIIILLMAVVTYLPRALPLQIKQAHWPQWIKISLEFLPVAIVASITIPSILINSYSSYFLTSEFFTTIVAIAVAFYSKNLIITVLLSLLFFIMVENFLFTS